MSINLIQQVVLAQQRSLHTVLPIKKKRQIKLGILFGALWLMLAVLIMVVVIPNAAQGSTVIGWGSNFYGQISPPAGLSGVVAISAGLWHSVALKSDGTVVAWGRDLEGQINVPADLSGVVAIAAGGVHTLALKSDGTVVAWGDNTEGQLNIPAGLSGLVAIAAGDYHTLALKSDGTVVAWGDNSAGQCNVPAGLSGVVAVAGGGEHSLALKSDGTVVAWGADYASQINVPTGLSGMVAIAGGDANSVALKSDGTVVAWGSNTLGQSNVPAGLSGVVAIAAGGGAHVLALKSDGTVVGWGDNASGQLNIPAGLSGVIAVAGGNDHSLALVNHAPIANAGNNQTLTIPHDGNPVTNTVPVTLDASVSYDPDGDPLTYTWSDGQGHAASGVNPTFNLPAGSHTFTLTVNDGHIAVTTTVNILVNPEPNQAPTANSQAVSLNQDTSAVLTLTGSDPDGDPIAYTLKNGPSHGTLSGSGANLTYTPNAGYVGTDSFLFTVTDPYGASNTATVSLTVKDTAPPVITLNGSNPMTITQGSAFTDPGATATDNVDGTVPVSVSGSVNTAVVGTYTLTYSATDSTGNKATKTRTVNVVATAAKIVVKVECIGRICDVVRVLVKVTNTSSSKATDVKLTAASLIGDRAFLVVPCEGICLNPGKSEEVLLSFCHLSKGQKGTLNISGTSSLGAFSLSQSVTIP
jgi:hypothetical protein